jgi:hypothetical protein
MLHLFFKPRKVYQDEPMFTNEYDSLEYVFKGDVDYCIYKLWNSYHGPNGEIHSIPEEQYIIKLNDFGKLQFIQTQKDWNSGRHYIGPHYYGKRGIEQPIEYYQQFYSGGTTFYYDERNRIVEYLTDVKFKEIPHKKVKMQFFYEDAENLYVKSDEYKYTYNELGQLIEFTACEISDEYYSRVVFEYDQEGRRLRILEYGYLSEYDKYEEETKRVDKGILLLYTIEYRYTKTSANETECVRGIHCWHKEDENHFKQVIVFDDDGFKKCHSRYRFDGTLMERSYYSFTFDQQGNWIEAKVDVIFDINDIPQTHHIYKREIYYK